LNRRDLNLHSCPPGDINMDPKDNIEIVASPVTNLHEVIIEHDRFNSFSKCWWLPSFSRRHLIPVHLLKSILIVDSL
jgi:hypothetical protein